jgi:hypothetical protein
MIRRGSEATILKKQTSADIFPLSRQVKTEKRLMLRVLGRETLQVGTQNSPTLPLPPDLSNPIQSIRRPVTQQLFLKILLMMPILVTRGSVEINTSKQRMLKDL